MEVPDVLRDAQGLVQAQRALLVAAAQRVHERRSERRERPGLERRVAGRRGLGTRSAQDLDARLDRARLQRCLARLELRQGRLAIAGRDPRVGGALAGREPQLGPRRDAELLPEQRFARGDLALGVRPPPAAREAADEQLLRLVVERVARDQLRGERRRPVDVARREARDGLVVRERARHTVQRAAHDAQPGVEDGTGRERHALQQLALRRAPIPDVDADARTQPQLQRIATGLGFTVERSAEIGERPPQRAERILGTREEQGRDAAAGLRSLREQQVGEQRPGLAPPRRRQAQAVALDTRRTEHPDDRDMRHLRHAPILPGTDGR